MLKNVPSGGTGVEELWQDEAIWTLKYEIQSWIADGTTTEDFTTLDNRKKSKIEVSADWCITIEH